MTWEDLGRFVRDVTRRPAYVAAAVAAILAGLFVVLTFSSAADMVCDTGKKGLNCVRDWLGALGGWAVLLAAYPVWRQVKEAHRLSAAAARGFVVGRISALQKEQKQISSVNNTAWTICNLARGAAERPGAAHIAGAAGTIVMNADKWATTREQVRDELRKDPLGVAYPQLAHARQALEDAIGRLAIFVGAAQPGAIGPISTVIGGKQVNYTPMSGPYLAELAALARALADACLAHGRVLDSLLAGLYRHRFEAEAGTLGQG